MITYRGVTYPWQCDHIGHMNVMWYVGKFDEASWNLLTEIGITPSYMRDQNRGVVALQQNISYRRELLAGDVIRIESRVLEIRDKVIRFAHDMYAAEPNELSAVCELTAAHLDREIRKACPFPDPIRRAAQDLIAPASPT